MFAGRQCPRQHGDLRPSGAHRIQPALRAAKVDVDEDVRMQQAILGRDLRQQGGHCAGAGDLQACLMQPGRRRIGAGSGAVQTKYGKDDTHRDSPCC
jgi:hypothetical protein